MNFHKPQVPDSRLTRLGFVSFIVVSVLVAILLATALNSFTRVTDSALADTAPTSTVRANAPSSISPAKRDYLPIIFLNSATAGGAWLLSGNAGTVYGTDFLGTTNNVSFTIRVSNTIAFRIAPSGTDAPNIIGGYSGNTVGAGVQGATIAGGGSAGAGANLVLYQYGTVGGGALNTASGNASTVAGGYGNLATLDEATVGGGVLNSATNQYSTIGGGYTNSAGGFGATVPGGAYSVASGSYSFAAGFRAKANHDGAFVWGDTTNADFASTANNQFLIRANGGVGIGTNNPVDNLDVDIGSSGTVDHGITISGNPSTYGDMGLKISNTGTGGAYWYLDSTNNGSGYGGGNLAFVGNGTKRMTINSSTGKVTVGGVVAAGGFNGTCRTDGVTASGPVCNQDFAEAFNSVERTAPGDLVALVTSVNGAPTVRKSTNAYDELVIGVVSQNPGLVFDNGQTFMAGDNSQLITNDKTVVALVGRVQVQVSIENGVINIGDPLTSSSTPGIAMKATQAGKIIGYAMGSTTNDGTVLALVQPGDYVPPAQLDALKQNAQLEARLSALEQGQGQSSNAFTMNNLPLWGIVGLLALWLVRRRES